MSHESGLRDQVIIQRQIAARILVVVACAPALATAVEVYAPGRDALAGGAAPSFAGPLSRWPAPAAPAIAELVDRAQEELGEPALDFEFAVDAADRPWLVQARPLTRDLQPGWGAFAAAVAARGETLPGGWWRLDAEHNPAPLSPAHAWVLGCLARAHAHVGGPEGPRVLAGWLYEPVIETERIEITQKLSKNKTKYGHDDRVGAGEDLSAAIAHLRKHAIPRARQRLAATDRALLQDSPEACAAALGPALAAVQAVLEVYAALAGPRGYPRRPPTRGAVPLCLVDRGEFLDVLPSAWDIAAPTLQELLILKNAGGRAVSAVEDTEDTENLEDPENAAWLLRELDDHLFALGLAPLRRVYLRAAEHLGLAAHEVFLLGGDELEAVLRGVGRLTSPSALAALLARRRALATTAAALSPPPQLVDGAPLPLAAYGHLRGLGLGEPVTGPLTKRRDLAELLAAPPEPGAIVALPALTAPAAVVLAELGIRALCCATGGALSHAALMVRELGISAILGCRGLDSLDEGERITLDTRRGRLVRSGDRYS